MHLSTSMVMLPFASAVFITADKEESSSSKMSSHSSSSAELALPVRLPVEMVSEEERVGERDKGGGVMTKEQMESLLTRGIISSSSSTSSPGVSDRYS